MLSASRTLALGIGSLFFVVSQVAAQAEIPDFPQVPRIQVPRFDGLPLELQKEFEKLQQELDQVFNQGLVQPNRPQLGSAMVWGGVQLKKVAADEQEKLGLPENEGLVIAAVDANSIGDKAGLKANDVLVKINNKMVPSDPTAFAKLVKDQDPAEAMDLVVLRNGKEETIKNARMPALVQTPITRRNPAIGGLMFRPNMMVPGMQLNPRNPRLPFPGGFGGLPNMNVEMNINGAKISKRLTGADFSGEYAKDELRITVAGKLENGAAKTSEITIQEGKETKKYNAIGDVPAAHRPMVQQLMPSTLNNLFLPLQQLQNFPGLPVIPGNDN